MGVLHNHHTNRVTPVTISREDFVEHFRTKYGSDHNDLPIWVACELMTFGTLFTFYRGCETSIQKKLADRNHTRQRFGNSESFSGSKRHRPSHRS